MATTFPMIAMTSAPPNVHPFFQKEACTPTRSSEIADAADPAQSNGLSAQDTYIVQPGPEPNSLGPDGDSRHFTSVFSNRSTRQVTLLDLTSSTAQDPTAHRAKRRRTASPPKTPPPKSYGAFQHERETRPGSPIHGAPSLEGYVDDSHCKDDATKSMVGNAILAHPGATTSANEHSATEQKLVLDGRGGFSTSAKTKPKRSAQSKPGLGGPSTGKRGRPRKSKVVVISYIIDPTAEQNIGQQIDDILDGSWTYRAPDEPSERQVPTFKAAINPNKRVHSFFSGRASAKASGKSGVEEQASSAIPDSSPRKVRFGTTPRKSRPMQVFAVDHEEDYAAQRISQATRKHRPGGMVDAPWPDHHFVRIEPEGETDRSIKFATCALAHRTRKGKLLLVKAEGNVVSQFHPAALSETRADQGIREMTTEHPTRTVETGADILQRIRASLSNPLPSHPAIEDLLQSIPTAVSAFDLGHSESASWCQKYAPTKADRVLQVGRETAILRDWLQSLAVRTVERAPKDIRQQLAPKPKPKKRARAKHRDLDDFIVDSEDDEQELTEVAQDGSFNADATQRTIVRNGGLLQDGLGPGQRLNNALLLSGPHGCGKSAAAYAVANELGYEVFEIHPGARRSGKDILDKVGDMASNHQVRNGPITAPITKETSSDREEDELREASPPPDMTKQKCLNSFFTMTAPKPNSSAKIQAAPATSTKKGATIQKALTTVQQAASHKQSLILLEEVDTLFDDDKLFWETVLQLAVQSKRPIIMTCSDERPVPLQALSLHGILRFRTPLPEIAVDLLLLIAASEGHILQRPVVEHLYHEKGRDLRASITQLDFMCQMGVGDPKGGLNWYLQRWPPGSDTNTAGHKLRVVSTNTVSVKHLDPGLHRGQSSYPQVEAFTNHGLESSELVFDAMDSQYICPSDKHETSHILHDVTSYSRALDTLGCIDIWHYPSGGLGMDVKHDRVDPSHPHISDKIRHSFSIDYACLDAELDRDERQISDTMALFAHLSLAGSMKGMIPMQTDESMRSTGPTQQSESHQKMRRVDLSAAFDPVSAGDSNSEGLMLSVFDGTMTTLVQDLAPYVRSIVSYDVALEQRRARLDSLLAGRSSKRQRTTRAARSAVEGGQRATTRRDRYFGKTLDYELVLKTGGRSWPQPGLASLVAAGDGLGLADSDFEASSRASTDVAMSSQ